MGVTAEAKVSASIEAEINSKGGTKGTQDTKSKQTTNTRSIDQKFIIPPKTIYKALATYDKTSLVVPYEDTLPLDCSFFSGGWDTRGIGTSQYTNYYKPWWGKDGVAKADSLLDWLAGFFGDPPNDDDFKPGLDITFSDDPFDVKIRTLIDNLRDATGALTITRKGEVVYANAGSFRFITNSTDM